MWYNIFMLERVRDFTRNFKPQGQITFAEWEGISDRFVYAKKFLSETNPIYLEMRAHLKESEDDIMENRLREVHNFDYNQTLGVVYRKFITPKKVQDDETIGQIKYLRDFFATLQSWIAEKERYEKDEADGKIIINRR